MSKPGEVWKILKRAYGLVESGRLWQHTIEVRLFYVYRVDTIPGIPQHFMRQSDDGSPRLPAANVIDHFLLAGAAIEIDCFNTPISERFKVGLFTQDTVLVFNCLHIKQFLKGEIELSVEEYMDTIREMDI